MSTVLIMAMKEEAQGLIDKLQLSQTLLKVKHPSSHELYTSESHPDFYLLLNGHWKENPQVSCVGTQRAAVSAWIAAEILGATQIINAGTAGGLKGKSAEIGDTYLVQKSFYHDRRIPIDDSWRSFARGGYNLEFSTKWVQRFSFKIGIASTGNSLDHVDRDLEILNENQCCIKDMELAAIAEYCEEIGIPLIGIKSITDLLDGEHPSAEEFVRNLNLASTNLNQHLCEFIPYLLAKKA